MATVIVRLPSNQVCLSYYTPPEVETPTSKGKHRLSSIGEDEAVVSTDGETVIRSSTQHSTGITPKNYQGNKRKSPLPIRRLQAIVPQCSRNCRLRRTHEASHGGALTDMNRLVIFQFHCILNPDVYGTCRASRYLITTKLSLSKGEGTTARDTSNTYPIFREKLSTLPCFVNGRTPIFPKLFVA
jgi:hypothetical protein